MLGEHDHVWGTRVGVKPSRDLVGAHLRVLLLLSILGIGGLLAACGSLTAPGGSDREEGSDSVSPTFSGPWAADFETMYARAGTEFERLALADEKVDDSEIAEVNSRFTECLTAFGFTDMSLDESGAFGFTAPDGSDPEVVNERVGSCADESGYNTVGSMYAWIRRNPENLDDDTIIAACMIREGAVDPSYSAEDFVVDEPEQTFPYLPGFGDEVFTKCNADPLGLLD